MGQKLMTLEESLALDKNEKTLWWYYWEAMVGRMPPTHRDYVPVGFFRKDNRDGKSWPVAIWQTSDGVKHAQIGSGKSIDMTTREAEADFAEKTFQYCCQKPISYESYQFWKTNRAWPIETAGEAAVEDSLRGIGDNSAGPATDHATFLDQVQAALAGLPGAKVVDSDEKAGAAQSLRSRLNELAGEGDKLRVEEKEPHLKAGRDVDEKWNPTIREAKAGAAELRKVIEAHETAKLRAERERKAAEEAASRPVVMSGPEPDRPAEAAPVTQIKGHYGRATSAKVRKEIDTIDYRAVCDQFVDTNDELRAVLRKIAQRAVDIGAPCPGVTTKDVARIR